VSTRLIEAQEEERRRIGSELHDDAIQVVTAIHLQLQRLRRRSETADIADELAEISKMTSAAIGRLRDMVFALNPVTLDHEGLVSALDEFGDEMVRPQGLDWKFTSSLRNRIGRATTIMAYRLAREAIVNSLRHASASTVAVAVVDGAPDGVCISIIDDGVGFVYDTEATPMRGHFGLAYMRERVAMMGGRLGICSADGGTGTRVDLWIPELRGWRHATDVRR